MAMESERYGTRGFNRRGAERETSVLVTIALQDRRPPHGTRVFQGALHIDEGFKVKAGHGSCPHCRRRLPFRIVLERVD
jgi:hypothetical protein